MFPSIRFKNSWRRISRHSVLALVVSTLCAPPPVALAQVPSTGASLPALGDGNELSAVTERRIGDRIAAQIYQDRDYVDDPVLVDYLQSIWQPLLAAARARGDLVGELQERFAWQPFLARDRSVNAFALPGGYFVVHLGLLANVSSADELAAVLGHEMSHVTQRHIARLMTQQKQQTPLMIATVLLGVLVAGKSGDAAGAAIVGGQAAAAQSQLNFSRDMEREADRVGFGVMTDAGFEGQGVASMFEKLQQAERLNDSGGFPYLRSHPLSTQRIGEAKARLQLAASSAVPSPEKLQSLSQAHLLHALMAARARVLADPAAVDALRALQAQATHQQSASVKPASVTAAVSPDTIRAAGALYAGVLAAGQLRDFAAAQSILAHLRPLVSSHPQSKACVEALALEMELLAGKISPQSQASAASSLATASQRRDVLLQARVLLVAQQSAPVVDKLQTWVAAHPQDAAAWSLLVNAYEQQNQPLRAIRADAESHLAQLDYSGALDRLKAAQALIRSQPQRKDYVEASIVDTRTRQTEAWLKEQALQDKADR